MLETFIVVGTVVGIIAGMILTLVRGALVDRTRARNKQLIMNHYDCLTGWPTENDPTPTKPDDQR